jgi:transcriptional regulator with XRE-family HTH domain
MGYSKLKIPKVYECCGKTFEAEQLGKSFNMVNAYAQNRRQPPIDVLYKIADILDVSVKDLLVDKG